MPAVLPSTPLVPTRAIAGPAGEISVSSVQGVNAPIARQPRAPKSIHAAPTRVVQTEQQALSAAAHAQQAAPTQQALSAAAHAQ